MTSGDSPAAARRRVRIALRSARRAKGLSQSQVAEAMEWSLSKMMRIESGEVTITPTDLRALLTHFGVTCASEIERLVDDAKASRRRQLWWSDTRYREHLPAALWQRVQFEADASTIRQFHGSLVPGLLQTPEYTAAVFDSFRGILTDEQIKVRTEVRLKRQREMFSRCDSPRLLVMLDESVLHRAVGGPEVMGRQLRDLLVRIEAGGVLIRISPYTDPEPIALLGPFAILDLADEQNALLYRENVTTDHLVEDPASIAHYRSVFERMWTGALGYEESAKAIESRAKAMLSPALRRRLRGNRSR